MISNMIWFTYYSFFIIHSFSSK